MRDGHVVRMVELEAVEKGTIAGPQAVRLLLELVMVVEATSTRQPVDVMPLPELTCYEWLHMPQLLSPCIGQCDHLIVEFRLSSLQVAAHLGPEGTLFL